jgi:hypothetical protein
VALWEVNIGYASRQSLNWTTAGTGSASKMCWNVLLLVHIRCMVVWCAHMEEEASRAFVAHTMILLTCYSTGGCPFRAISVF